MKEMKKLASGESGLDKLMAMDPDLAGEIASVAKLQKQVIILKRSNNSLRNKTAQTHAKLLKDYEVRDIECSDLRGKLYDKEREIKALQLKLKDLTKRN